jgi:hypothetical protein
MKRIVKAFLLGIIILIAFIKPAFGEIPSIPSLPKPGYKWYDSGSAFYYIENYSAAIVVGMYVPESINLGENVTIYFYFTRVLEVVTFPLGIPISGCICIGLCYNPFSRESGIHIGIRLKPIQWCKIKYPTEELSKHIPIWPPILIESISMSVSYPSIYYSSIYDIPYGKWDGPYIANVTIVKGYVVPEFPINTIAFLLKIVLAFLLILIPIIQRKMMNLRRSKYIAKLV